MNVDAFLTYVPYENAGWSDLVTLYYLTRVTRLHDAGLLVPSKGAPTLLLRHFDSERARLTGTIRDVKGVDTVPFGKGIDALKEIMRGVGINNGSRIGVDEFELTLQVYNAIKESFPSLQIVPVGSIIRDMRIRKSKDEIEKTRKACAIADRVFSKISENLPDRLQENELAALGKAEAIRAGAGNAIVIVISGTNATLPYNDSGQDVVEGDKTLICVVACSADGYWCDVNRTLVIGNLSERQLNSKKAVIEALETGVRSIREGIRGETVASACRNVIAKYNLPQPPHRIGHGIGLSIPEAPIIEKEFDYTLGDGMTFTIEPGTYVPESYGIRLGHNIAITDGEPVVLDKYPLE
jgi:Xaa-Pro dipeptidase